MRSLSHGTRGWLIVLQRRHALILGSARIVQFNRRPRKGIAHIQRVDPGKLGDVMRKISNRQPLRAQECWRLFAILAVLAVKFLGSGHYTPGSRPVKAMSAGRRSAGDLGRLAGGVVRGLRVPGGAVLTRSHMVGIREAGVFEHREEDLPRHGAGNSVGPLGLVRRDPVTNQSDIARLEPTAWAWDSDNLAQP